MAIDTREAAERDRLTAENERLRGERDRIDQAERARPQ